MPRTSKFISLPPPACDMGYTMKQAKEMFGSVGFLMLMEFMNGQTMTHCSSKYWDNEKKDFVPSVKCSHESSTIFFYNDIVRFANRLPIID